jgi:EAL domain-containing protein (putative c-di-GMP-specific phosphodiesterase class I)
MRPGAAAAMQSEGTRDTLSLEPGRAEELNRRLTETTPPAAPPSRRARPSWHLEAVAADGVVRVVPLHPLPFRIGRRPGLELVLAPDSVSKVHAEIYEAAGRLRIRDLQSTNGTFVNGEAVEDGPIGEGDVVHLGEVEFRVGVPASAPAPEPPEASGPGTTVSLGRRTRAAREMPGAREMQELLRDGNVTIAFQPIVRLPGGVPEAYEALGRGTHPGLPQSPLDLLHLAENLGQVAELSRLFRKKAVELVRNRPNFPTLFLNTHPDELKDPRLIGWMEELRDLAPHLDLALEIHEKVLTKEGFVGFPELKKMLSESNIYIAYDDFGAGEARLLELADAPPHYLKFDRRFVMSINQPELRDRRQLLGSLVSLARDLRVKAIAEGIETAEEASTCEEIGFQLAQGYHFGRPSPIDTIAV